MERATYYLAEHHLNNSDGTMVHDATFLTNQIRIATQEESDYFETPIGDTVPVIVVAAHGELAVKIRNIIENHPGETTEDAN